MKQVFKEILAKCCGCWAKETILNFHDINSYFLRSGYKAITQGVEIKNENFYPSEKKVLEFYLYFFNPIFQILYSVCFYKYTYYTTHTHTQTHPVYK